jgi:hypothetical protein
MFGGAGRGPLRVPYDLDALLLGDTASRQVSPTALRSSYNASRFDGAPLAVSPIRLSPNPQTIPVGGAPAFAPDADVPANIFTPQVSIGR